MGLRIFVNSLGILGEASIQQDQALGLYMQGTGSVVGERRLSLIVHYSKESMILRVAPIVLIKEYIVQVEVRKLKTIFLEADVTLMKVQSFRFFVP